MKRLSHCFSLTQKQNNPNEKTTGNVKAFIALIFISMFSVSSLAQTASNGLTKVSNDIRLGGTLTQNTTIDVGASYFFRLSKSSQDYLTVLNGGNVGIGLSSPSYLLDVNGAVRIGSLTADPTGANGVLYYNSSTNRLKTYVAGGWTNILAEGIASGDYIQNQTASAQAAGFNINGNGVIGGTLSANTLQLTAGSIQTNGNIFGVHPTNGFSIRIGGTPYFDVNATDVTVNASRLNLPQLSSDPLSGATVQGWMYYNTTDGRFKGRLGDGSVKKFLMEGDVPTAGANDFIQNQNATAQTGNFKISGEGYANLLSANSLHIGNNDGGWWDGSVNTQFLYSVGFGKSQVGAAPASGARLRRW